MASQSIAETLRTDVGKAMKLAFHNLGNSEYKTRDPCISNVDEYDSVEVSLLLCDDDFIRKLNKEWRGEDRATDVLSMSQHIPGLQIPVLQLGDLVISVETARRQAEERGHTLLDEIRILMNWINIDNTPGNSKMEVHGLLHLLGFDHELSKEAEEEMEQEEEKILNTLEWIGKGLIRSAYHFSTDMGHSENSDGHLRSESIESLREAVSRGVTVIMLTGKTRASTIATFKLLNMEGRGDFISENSAGVFLQGSLVYGEHGQLIYRANLDVDICKEVVIYTFTACLYSLKHKIPLVAYCEEQCLTLFEHPSVNLLHTVHHETKVKVMPSVEDLLEYSSIQKLLFLGNKNEDFSVLTQHWSELTEGKACVIKEQPNAIEIVPLNASKGGDVLHGGEEKRKPDELV
ncbi:putative rRNA maturation factor [Triticum urartu]|uniref:Putative rRNA maturation factor n=1 Tax=Triticum urartu TaxID=4572 RepID=M7YEF7_TRIUA|nr:putative rRNA maturation factor [Triticum urartu]